MVSQNRREESFIKRVNQLIEVNMKDEGFGVSELASQMNKSRSNLHRRIKSRTGLSVSQLVRNVRLNKALELLKNDSITVAEAAYMVGFESASYFSRCFHDYFGYTPVEVSKRTYDVTGLEDRKDGDTSEESKRLPNNFPVQTSSFIGREREIGKFMERIRFDLPKQVVFTINSDGFAH